MTEYVILMIINKNKTTYCLEIKVNKLIKIIQFINSYKLFLNDKRDLNEKIINYPIIADYLKDYLENISWNNEYKIFKIVNGTYSPISKKEITKAKIENILNEK